MRWSDVQEGTELVPVTLPISFRRIVHNAASTWDWYPGHHNPFYAQEQGQETIFLSTLFFHGFVDRAVTDWAGPEAVIRRRAIQMRRSIYAGQVATARGRVTGLRRDDRGRGLVDLELVVESEDGPCVPAQVTVELPD